MIVAYEKDNGGASAIGIKRFQLSNTSIIEATNNPYNIPAEYAINNCNEIEGLAMDGSPGQGPVLIYMHYETYANDTNIKAINLRTGRRFDVTTAAGWQYTGDVYVDNVTGAANVVYRDDAYPNPGTNTASLLSKENLESILEQSQVIPEPTGEKFASAYIETLSQPPYTQIALITNEIKDRPIPTYCGAEGTYYLDTDANKDCHVDLNDFIILAQNWLRDDCSLENNRCNGTDVVPTQRDEDHKVNYKDYELFVSDLGKSTDPQDPDFRQISPPLIDPNITIQTRQNVFWDRDEDDLYYEYNSRGYLFLIYHLKI